MSAHGGARPGAGAPARGVSQAKRLIQRALERGLTLAGREKGLDGTDEEVATEAAALIARDLVQAGRGDEVLKLLVVATPAREAEGDSPKRSLLAEALGRLPGMDDDSGPVASLEYQPGAAGSDGSGTYDARPTDQRSVGRGQPVTVDPEGRPSNGLFWPGQPQLPFGSRDQAGQGTPPHTPPAGSPSPYPVQAENFEKIPGGGE